MRPSFHPRLINGPFGDPGLFVAFSFAKRAVAFDLGDLHALSAKDILKIGHAFITHTHMDHFIGFDMLLRIMLGRGRTLCIYGPEGFIENVEGKLSGYAWNLVENYHTPFSLDVFEILPDRVVRNTYCCKKRFQPDRDAVTIPFGGVLLEEPAFTVKAVILDHHIPCLGFAISEKYHINIKKQAVWDMGLDVGPWLNRFKTALYRHGRSDRVFRIPPEFSSAGERSLPLAELAENIAVVTPGQKVVYISDVAYTQPNIQKILAFARDADQFFIEAPFLEADQNLAEKKRHLTARQAGTIAGKAGVRQFTIFHFSPRYAGMERRLHQEAMAAFMENKPAD